MSWSMCSMTQVSVPGTRTLSYLSITDRMVSLTSAFCPVGGGLHPLGDLLPQPAGLYRKIKDGLEPAS